MKQRVKINEDVAALYIARHHKEIGGEIRLLSLKHNFAGVLQAVVNLLKSLIEKGRTEKAIHHIKYIGWVYQRGNSHIQYLIENLFVRSFESIRKRCAPEQWKLLYVEIPQAFKTFYLTQNNFSNNKIC